MDVLSLQQSKNRCLERFCMVTSEFLSALEAGDWSGLERFQEEREQMLHALEIFDRKLSETAQRIPLPERTDELIAKLQSMLQEQSERIAEVLRCDQLVIAAIEKESARLSGEIHSNVRSRDMIRKFRSQWVTETGEELDGKL